MKLENVLVIGGSGFVSGLATMSLNRIILLTAVRCRFH